MSAHSRSRKSLSNHSSSKSLSKRSLSKKSPYFKSFSLSPAAERRVIGRGGYGCVVSPAIVFWNSKVVNNANSKMYVTKIASDALEEYDLGKTIERLAPDAGIFPVDEPVCDLSNREISLIKNFDVECERLFENDTWERYVARPKYMGMANIKLNYNPKVGMQKHVRGIRGGDFESVCAIQYPKYDSDLTRVNVTSEIRESLWEKLTKLHTANVVHLDIKRQNIAMIGSEPFFADWGFSHLLETNEQIDEASDFVMESSLKNYYKELAHFPNLQKDLKNSYYIIRDKVHFNHAERKDAIKDIDEYCLESALRT